MSLPVPPSLWCANTSAEATVMVRPGRTTRPEATNQAPAAGASRFTLNSMVSTSEPGGMRVSAA
ncbi:MAG TPA: hypothetical protein VFS00_20040 [Polyangiaceae bacterium]|nr:hypothetical protein [Polyangiaceae bacterium]